ncbi:plasmid mobilization relaxosome protein MobC [Neisseria zalophi]|uniref:Plasmid mobilization relaxosome protein MobC n=1 Tax=Neisseria zalophi TaxID=640030 RepID=A0A5J6PU04_9NEIS|nr:plasmid mobilization relaxosome protein MobC [Neisseria zalophi]QEY25794.1 plasmid mobilization relaxosome protein MobC [Neisseria zalophi]
MSKKIDVYGLSDAEIKTLREIAYKLYGKASVSLLAKKLLQKKLQAAAEPEPIQLPPPKCQKRITLRLPDKDRAYLEAAADKRRGTINDVARDIIQSHISHHPILSAFETDTLSQSNYQLVMIGRNLNQIARRLNAGENVSLNSQQIGELKKFIDAHVGKVNHVLQTNRRRKRE